MYAGFQGYPQQLPMQQQGAYGYPQQQQQQMFQQQQQFGFQGQDQQRPPFGPPQQGSGPIPLSAFMGGSGIGMNPAAAAASIISHSGESRMLRPMPARHRFDPALHPRLWQFLALPAGAGLGHGGGLSSAPQQQKKEELFSDLAPKLDGLKIGTAQKTAANHASGMGQAMKPSGLGPAAPPPAAPTPVQAPSGNPFA